MLSRLAAASSRKVRDIARCIGYSPIPVVSGETIARNFHGGFCDYGTKFQLRPDGGFTRVEVAQWFTVMQVMGVPIFGHPCVFSFIAGVLAISMFEMRGRWLTVKFAKDKIKFCDTVVYSCAMTTHQYQKTMEIMRDSAFETVATYPVIVHSRQYEKVKYVFDAVGFLVKMVTLTKIKSSWHVSAEDAHHVYDTLEEAEIAFNNL